MTEKEGKRPLKQRVKGVLRVIGHYIFLWPTLRNYFLLLFGYKRRKKEKKKEKVVIIHK